MSKQAGTGNDSDLFWNQLHHYPDQTTEPDGFADPDPPKIDIILQ